MNTMQPMVLVASFTTFYSLI